MRSLLIGCEFSIINDYYNEDIYDKLKELNWQIANGKKGRMHFNCGYDYVFSRKRVIAEPIPDFIQEIINKINHDFNHNINSCYANLYKNRLSELPFHSDSESQLNPKSNIFILSFGSERNITFRNKISMNETTFSLPPNSLAIMGKHCQSKYLHAIKKSEYAVKERISLTFREFEKEVYDPNK